MNRNRLVAVRATVKGKHARLSSGCVIAPHLVLTAGHALQPQTAALAPGGAHVQVQLFGDRRLVPARVAWDGRPAGLDAAVLRIAPEHWPADAGGSPVRFGRFVTLEAGRPAHTLGFARVQGVRRPEGMETAQVSGTVSPGDGMLGERWELSVDRAPAALEASPWSGLSGAALWSGPLLCGVVTVDLAHWKHGKLEAVPLHVMLRDPELRALLHRELGSAPVAEAVELEALCEPAVPLRAPRLPSELLRPQAEVVAFTGRTDELREFAQWCEEGGGLATRLITGRGGQGKSRFARELSARLAADGWVTAQLRESDADRSELLRSLKALTTVDHRMLLVMDYAETSPELVGTVVETLEARGGHHPVRMVLIARSAGEWWEQLPGATPRSSGVLGGADTVELSDVAGSYGARVDMYRGAVTALARRLPGLRQLPEYARADWPSVARSVLAQPAADLASGSALQLQMRALLDLLTAADRQTRAAGARPRPARQQRDVQAELLDHERRYWKRTAGAWAALDGLGTGVLADAVAAATLTRADDMEHARALLGSLLGLGAEVVDALIEWLCTLYPPAEGACWGALEPDLLGEYHVALRIRDNAALLTGLLPRLTGRAAERALTVLARAAAQPACPCPDLPERVAKLVVAHPESLAVPAVVVAGRSENPGFLLDALQRLARRRDLPLDLLETLHAAVPDRSRLLGEQALGLAQRLARAHRRRLRLSGGDLALAPARAKAGLARAEHNLAVRLCSVRRWSDAVESSSRAIQLYRGLSRGDAAGYLPLMAESLGVRWGALSELGRHQEAMADCAEAVRVNRRLVADAKAARTPAESMAHRARLGQALNNLSVVLASRQLAAEALIVSQEAVRILDDLAEERPTRHHLALLAAALHNTANRIVLGFDVVSAEAADQEGLRAVTRAVLIRRRLAQVQPDAYLPGLVESLHNQALELVAHTSYQGACEVIDECLRVALQLAENQPVIHRPTLARVLRSRAVVFAAAGRRKEAVRSAVTAVLLYRRLARGPGEFDDVIQALLREIADLTLFAGASALQWLELTREADALVAEGRARTHRAWLRRTRRARARARLRQWAGIRLRVSLRPFEAELRVPPLVPVPEVDPRREDQEAFRAVLSGEELSDILTGAKAPALRDLEAMYESLGFTPLP
ncbi:serine protease [Streptomyces sp. NPDC052225]|uniref:serine protease n=1 Tax=Streptomyces sp. NPDC052225 TaxID=3154949 RepID=UPI003426036E